MSDNMVRLLALLESKERLMEELSCSLEEEQSRIIDMNSVSMEESNRCKEEVTSRLARLTDECHRLMESLAAERGITEEITLSLLIGSASDSEKERLVPLQRRLLLLAGSLGRQQELNRRLLSRSLGLIQRSLSLIGGLLGGGDVYGARGRLATGSMGMTFLSREI